MTETKFLDWMNGNESVVHQHRPNTIEKADILSQSLFNKDYEELITYQKRYIIKTLGRCE